MSLPTNPKNKKLIVLALISATASVLFSFMGSPFLRAFAASAKSYVFWLTGLVLIGLMFATGSQNYKVSETAVYVGAIWMTLGSYSELEKRGIKWKFAMPTSLVLGLLFALAGYFLVLKNLSADHSLIELVAPLHEALTKAFPSISLEQSDLISYLPGIFLASLAGSLGLGFVFEANVFRMFRLKRERIASSLRWLEFRLPDFAVWLTLFAILFTVENFGFKPLQTVGINWLVVASVGLFFQGLTVIEFMIRFYRLGLFTRTAIYLLIVLQLAPFVVLVGLVDYWADFRKLVRKKLKTT
ncbi:DUF2232 domain-containing protein [Pseudobdellovibrio exovorus]|uniref:DUF2232 domain-containing protein n=1 Tax=Pseudobdellovibrio exovorus JSS TaxID=1184267 RepID=M4V8C4_9BACT|nr:DUF2232 domain-containing protein [Pseudobdellovibrio exovorus]AGH94251.1 hypothetical protein A11Q_31 [Pseudobdellovibrio exovorus JSS]